MGGAADKIVIEDLRNPVLTEAQRQALAAAEAHPVVLSERAILDAACAATGLSDFGPPDFRERLRQWIVAIEATPDKTALGCAGLFGELVRYASNRLRIEDLVKRHPEIQDIVIDRPIIVAGLPRSGTTFFQNVLSADDRLRSLPFWEALRPVPEPGAETADRDNDPRRVKALVDWAQHDALMPYVKAIHEMSADHTSEDVELQAIDFGSYLLEWYLTSPLAQANYFASDTTATYRYMKKVLQVLTWYHGPNRWLLKCPQHMEQLPALHRVFPDATIVLTHRDPVASIQSAVTALAYAYRLTRTRIDTDALGSYWVPRYEKLLRACVRDHGNVPRERVVDIYFHELMASPMDQIVRVYEAAGLPLTETARARLAASIADNRRGKHGQVVYDLRGDFGLEPGEVRKRFDFYFEHFPVQKEAG